MAISDKLTYLNDTKTQLKDMINYGLDTGEKITSETTFRNYVKSLFDAFIKTMTYPDVLYNNLPKVTGEGTSLTLNDTVYAPMRVELSPSALEQESTSGKNLLDLSSEPMLNLYASKTFIEPKIEITKTYANQNAFCIFEIGNASDLNGINLKLTGTCLASGTTKGELKLGYADANGSNRMSISDTNQISQETFEINMTVDGTTYSTKKVVVWLYSDTTQTGNIGDKIVYENVMVSTTGGEYEPYTGGIASPNPQYPQEIHTVSGENNVLIRHINMWNEDWEQGYYNSSGVKAGATNTAIRSKDYIPVRPNTNYYYYNGTNSLGRMCYYDKNKIFISSESNSNVIRTTPENCYYITISTSTTYGSTYNNNICVNISNTNINGTYYPHKEQTYPLSLGDLEYCKIGDYEDLFFKNVVGSDYYDSTLELDKWYLKKNVGKVVLNGSETGWDMGTGTNVFMNTNIFNNTYLVQNAYSNYFKNIVNENITGTGTANNNLQNNEFSFRWGTKDRIYIKTDVVSTIADFKTWLSTHNTIVYYVLATPTYTLLSDTLQTQLDNIQKAISYQDQTNASQTNADLPFVLSLSAIRDLSGIFELIQG